MVDWIHFPAVLWHYQFYRVVPVQIIVIVITDTWQLANHLPINPSSFSNFLIYEGSGVILLSTFLRRLQKLLTVLGPWALQSGRQARCVLSVFYERRWEQSLEDLRRELNIQPAPVITSTSRKRNTWEWQYRSLPNENKKQRKNKEEHYDNMEILMLNTEELGNVTLG